MDTVSIVLGLVVGWCISEIIVLRLKLYGKWDKLIDYFSRR